MSNIAKKRYLKKEANYDKLPFVKVSSDERDCIHGWKHIITKLRETIAQTDASKPILVIETYHGVHNEELKAQLQNISHALFIDAKEQMLPRFEVDQIVEEYLGEHPVFGFMSDLEMKDLMDEDRVVLCKKEMEQLTEGTIIIYGAGASLLTKHWDVLVYADMARWEIQQRMRRNEISNLGTSNKHQKTSLQYKRGYFVDWRICDRLKKTLMSKWDFVLDTNKVNDPKMVTAELIEKGLQLASTQPFRVVPFFDPGVWGGQWMKEVCDLDRSKVNYAWCFDCVPEENSLLLGFGSTLLEVPAINLVFRYPTALLGQEVYDRFGAEFPIRFDFLDTMDGGNLSLQVHPVTDYIKEHFGMDYTQDESYYLLDVEGDAVVYLGFKEGVEPEQVIAELEAAQHGGQAFDAEKHVNKIPVQKHDHILIPAGTIHCSGKNSMVLEISATPYIFTFKLWDWGRVDFDGQPRPISLEHGKKVLQWDRTTEWTEKELVNPIEAISAGEGWREERTGLHESEFIETRRHWFTSRVLHDTNGNLNVLNLIEGRSAIVESPSDAFKPFIVHYAETFIVPASVGAYTIRPYGESEGKECGTLKAYVRA